MTEVRKECDKPVFSFEVGQFEVLPDFDEIGDFKGATRAVNYELIRKKVIEEGLLDTWKQQVEATGEMSNLCRLPCVRNPSAAFPFWAFRISPDRVPSW